MEEIILNYIKEDPISYIHISELLKKKYTIIYASDKGFIINDDDIDLTYISFNDEKEMQEVLSKKRYEHYLTYDKEVCDFYKDDTDKMVKLYQYVYESEKLFDGLDNYDLRVLDVSYTNLIDSVYKALSEDTSENALRKKEVIGLFEDNKLAGFIGRHPEGCIGMLLVFEEYRHKGYAEALEKAKINDLIKRNEKVFNEVVTSNDASNHLQAKLGHTRGKKIIYWQL